MRDNHHASSFHDQHGNGGDRADGAVSFTIVDGQVTGLARVVGGETVALALPSDATFTAGAGTVTETRTHGTSTETLTYTADAADATLYHLSQDVKTFDTSATGARSYTFTLTDGAVTAVAEGAGAPGHAHAIDVSSLAGVSFSVSGNTITETTVHGNALETLLYTSTDGATYKLVSATDTIVATGAHTGCEVDIVGLQATAPIDALL